MAKGIWGRAKNWFWDMMFGDQVGPAALEESSFTLGEAPSGAAPSRGGGKRDPAMSIIKKVGLAAMGEGGGRDFEAPEFNFAEITEAYDTEGYVRQAVDKYVEMIFKAGWSFVGKNPTAVEYIVMRFKLMAEATQIPTNQLFLEIAEDLVKYHNVIIAKARAKDNLPFQGMNVMGVGENMPVAGYFPLNVATMQVKRDKFGVVKGWQQEVEGQDKPVKFKPQDIVHIYYKREKGKAFATPFLLPALDDIRALRQIEEQVLRLVYRNLHPLWHIKVGLEQEGFGAEPEEVDVVRAEVENMDVEGGLVTNERVNITSVASNQIIDAKEYVKHFEQRVFSVMGVSELLMGRGNTANRSTGDNISGEFADRCKAYQRISSTFVDEFMIKEILMEGGFDPVLNPDDAVNFVFNEIDKDSQIKHENQAVFLYEHNAISETEMRQLIGRDPIEDGEVRAGMHLNVITIPTIQAEGDIQMQIAALKPAPGATSGSGGSAKAKPKSTAGTDNKTKPANQHGVKSSPKKATNYAHVRYMKGIFHEYSQLSEATQNLVVRHFNEGGTQHLSTICGAMLYTESRILEITADAFGEEVSAQLKMPVSRMMEDIREKVMGAVTSLDGDPSFDHAKETTQVVFDVFTDRLGAIAEKACAMSEKEVEIDA